MSILFTLSEIRQGLTTPSLLSRRLRRTFDSETLAPSANGGRPAFNSECISNRCSTFEFKMLLEHQFVENRSKEKSGECTPLSTTQITVNLIIMFDLRNIITQLIHLELNFATLKLFEIIRYDQQQRKKYWNLCCCWSYLTISNSLRVAKFDSKWINWVIIFLSSNIIVSSKFTVICVANNGVHSPDFSLLRFSTNWCSSSILNSNVEQRLLITWYIHYRRLDDVRLLNKIASRSQKSSWASRQERRRRQPLAYFR